jgi:hypothetical protein
MVVGLVDEEAPTVLEPHTLTWTSTSLPYSASFTASELEHSDETDWRKGGAVRQVSHRNDAEHLVLARCDPSAHGDHARRACAASCRCHSSAHGGRARTLTGAEPKATPELRLQNR